MRTADLDEMIEFVTRVFGTISKNGEPDLMAGIWARELLRGDHPTTRPEDGAVVVDQQTGRIVACCFLISQVWKYEEIPFAIGRPELIASDPDYRGRGLIREQLIDIHSYSAALGHRMQALTGIPYYYRQYGYEPTLITEGSRRGSIASFPGSAANPSPDIRIRPALESDLPFITRMHEQAARRVLVSAKRDEAIWRHELIVRDPRGDYWHELQIVEDSAGGALGFFAFVAQIRGDAINCTLAELTDDLHWPIVGPAILRYLRQGGAEIAARTGETCNFIEFDWSPDHPFLASIGNLLLETGDSFAWYVRIETLGEFIRHIAPVLERRLAGSDLAGFTGSVSITFYPTGLRLGFNDGRLIEAVSLADASHRSADAAIPGRTILQLLFGSRTLDELEHAFPFESFTRNETARRLLQTIFPKRPSAVWPIA